jgi:endo-1,4-beta-D-glucanase Y
MKFDFVWHVWDTLWFLSGFALAWTWRPEKRATFREPYVSIAMLMAAREWADKQNEMISLNAIQGILRIAIENVKEEE